VPVLSDRDLEYSSRLMAASTRHRGQQTEEGERGAYILLLWWCDRKQGRLTTKKEDGSRKRWVEAARRRTDIEREG
jgi:hypothetical protein